MLHAWLGFILGASVVVFVLLLFSVAFGITYFGLDVSSTIVIAVALIVVAAIASWLLYAAIRAQFRRVKTGKEALIGACGVTIKDLEPKGEIRVLGEFWQATSKEGQISEGEIVEVVALEGMFLVVKRVEEKA